jgi:salicylate hydroxylase
MALEDAVVIAAVLSKTTKPEEIESAFKVYDEIRRPRAQAIVDSSRLTGRIMTGLEAEVGLESEQLAGALGARWGFIYDFDVNKHREEALVKLDTLL